MSGRIRRAFESARTQDRACLVVFLEAGDPGLDVTRDLVVAVAKAGAGIIELGVPFSDPIADGPVIQRASERALKAGGGLRPTLKLVKELRADGFDTPIVLFGYVNPVLAMGEEAFLKEASAADIDGVLFTDLPPEEGAEFSEALVQKGIDPIFLLAPTSTPVRIRRAASLSRGFVYLVSRAGVTGERKDLPEDLPRLVERVREAENSLPVAIGFGISTPEHVQKAARLGDGVVVGSVVVREIEEAARKGEPVVERAVQLVESLRGALARS